MKLLLLLLILLVSLFSLVNLAQASNTLRDFDTQDELVDWLGTWEILNARDCVDAWESAVRIATWSGYKSKGFVIESADYFRRWYNLDPEKHLVLKVNVDGVTYLVEPVYNLAWNDIPPGVGKDYEPSEYNWSLRK